MPVEHATTALDYLWLIPVQQQLLGSHLRSEAHLCVLLQNGLHLTVIYTLVHSTVDLLAVPLGRLRSGWVCHTHVPGLVRIHVSLLEAVLALDSATGVRALTPPTWYFPSIVDLRALQLDSVCDVCT